MTMEKVMEEDEVVAEARAWLEGARPDEPVGGKNRKRFLQNVLSVERLTLASPVMSWMDVRAYETFEDDDQICHTGAPTGYLTHRLTGAFRDSAANAYPGQFPLDVRLADVRFAVEQGADEITFLDITASHEARQIMLDVVQRVSDTIFMPFTVGGGMMA